MLKIPLNGYLHCFAGTTELRELTLTTILACRAILDSQTIPKAVYQAKKCRGCSLLELCHPQNFTKSAAAWLAKQLAEN